MIVIIFYLKREKNIIIKMINYVWIIEGIQKYIMKIEKIIAIVVLIIILKKIIKILQKHFFIKEDSGI